MRIEFIVRCVGKDGGDAVVMGMKVVVVVVRRRWCRLLLLWWWWQRRIWWGLMVVVVKEMGGEGGRRARGREKGIKKKIYFRFIWYWGGSRCYVALCQFGVSG